MAQADRTGLMNLPSLLTIVTKVIGIWPLLILRPLYPQKSHQSADFMLHRPVSGPPFSGADNLHE